MAKSLSTEELIVARRKYAGLSSYQSLIATVDALTAENARLRDALEGILSHHCFRNFEEPRHHPTHIAAKAALKPVEE